MPRSPFDLSATQCLIRGAATRETIPFPDATSIFRPNVRSDGARGRPSDDRLNATYRVRRRSPPEQEAICQEHHASVSMLTNDSQIGSDLRVCADEDDRMDFDQQR